MEGLPEEIVLLIFSFCGQKTVFELGKVCTLFRRLSVDSKLTKGFGHKKRMFAQSERRWFFSMMNRMEVSYYFLKDISGGDQPKKILVRGNRIKDFRRETSVAHITPPHKLVIYYDISKKIHPNDDEGLSPHRIYYVDTDRHA